MPLPTKQEATQPTSHTSGLASSQVSLAERPVLRHQEPTWNALLREDHGAIRTELERRALAHAISAAAIGVGIERRRVTEVTRIALPVAVETHVPAAAAWHPHA